MEITGGCLCKAIRYRIAAKPIVTRECWCRACQYLGAGSSTVNTCFPKAALTLTGVPQDYLMMADSGNVMHRSFCPTCGTPLFSEAEARPHLIFVRNGSLDDIELSKPALTIWTSEAPSWACFNVQNPSIEGQPPPAG